ncbi:MAG TPA: hypothetical protein VFZ66_19070 [Herpetosiphonaceae bacterium]
MEIDPQIAALMNAIPEADRPGFERYYAERLGKALRDAEATPDTPLGTDPTRIERQLIEDLIREAEGRDSADGLGLVPGSDLTYRIQVPERDPRTEAGAAGTRRATGAASGEMTPARWAVVGAAILVLLGYALVSTLRGTPTEASADALEATATSTPTALPAPILPTALGDLGEAGAVTVADPTSLEIRRADGSSVVLRVVPSSGVLGGTWTPFVADDQAAWLSGTVINSVFCLPAEAEQLMTNLKRGSTILMRPASGTLRRYEVMRVRTVGRQQVEVLDQRRAGMTLLRCGESGSTRAVVEAVYRPDTVQQPIHTTGTNAALADLARVQVQAVTVLTPTADLPPGLSVARLTVEVANLSTAELAWTDLADQLEIGGSVAETVPSVPQAALGPKETRRVSFRYRVPSIGGEALWRVTAATGESVTVRVTIPPAPVVSQLHATLHAENVRQLGTGTDARLAITATITNTGSEPITLDPQAAGVWDGATVLPLDGESTPLPLLLPPGRATPLTLAVEPPADPATLTVQIGQQRWRLTIP